MQIPLTMGYFAEIDDADYDIVKGHRWHARKCQKTGRVCAGRGVSKRIGGKKVTKIILMHREIAGNPQGVLIDHINRNALDNRRCNLRVASHWQNLANNGRRAGQSGLRSIYRRKNSWVVFFRHKGVDVHVGSFSDLEAAKSAYNQRASELRGEFAQLYQLSA